MCYHNTQYTTQRQTHKYTTQYVLDTTTYIYNTKTNTQIQHKDKYKIQIHNTICVRYHHTQDTTRRQTNKYTTQYVLDTTIHKIQHEDKQTNTQHNMC